MNALGLLPAVATLAACEQSCSRSDDATPRAAAASASDWAGRRVCEGAVFYVDSGIETCSKEPGYVGPNDFAHRPRAGTGCVGKSRTERWEEGQRVPNGCVIDADCEAGLICRCEGNFGGSCRVADCETDNDCAPGAWCAESKETCREREFHCQLPEDECLVDADCQGNKACQRGPFDHHRVCVPASVCGRPFLVRDTPRVAALVSQAEWAEAQPLSMGVGDLSVAERHQLSRHYAQAGLMEHASVAAFARFALQLLSLGAPAMLVDGCARAMADEVRHTRACFELASRYAQQPLGPGPLPTQDCLPCASLAEVLDLVIVEGCIGETLAALEVAEAAAHAQSPALCTALAQIAADERSHAELSFRFAQWALAQAPELRLRAEKTFAAALAGLPPTPQPEAASTPRLAAHGLLSERDRTTLRAAAVRDIVVPCAAALLG